MSEKHTSRTGDVHVAEFEPLAPPNVIKGALPLTADAESTVLAGREELRAALSGKDSRLVVILGPCSIHDRKSALEYATKLNQLRKEVSESLLLVMRVYFEKPRTTLGWKGLINDPKLDGSADINLGLRKAREILLEIVNLGLPCATEFLDPIVPQYTADLVSWAAIGARTTESQTHREMASGLSMPVGFKNSTDGELQTALNAMVSSQGAHAFLGIDQDGRSSIVRTRGNENVHLVLRGGEGQPNYSPAHIAFAKASLNGSNDKRLIMVDCSHGNSAKDFRKQSDVFENLLAQFLAGEHSILGMMLESHLSEGKQKLVTPEKLSYGVSITDGCIGWDTTESLLRKAAAELKKR